MNGIISIEEWTKKIDFELYLKKIYEKEAMITKVQLLNAFIEEYEIEIVEEYNKLRQTIKVKSLDKDTFEKLLLEIDPNIQEYDRAKLFNDLKKNEKTKNVSPEGFCITVLKNKIGSYGKGIFGNIYLDISSLNFE